MKRILTIFVSLFAFGVVQSLRADVIADWTFETSIPVAARGPGIWFTNIAPEIGLGTAAGFHAGPTVYTSPAGTGAGSTAHSFSSTNWTVGDFYQFAVSTATNGGYFSGISLSYNEMSSATGPGRFQLSYSTDGLSFTSFGPLDILPSATYTNYSYNLSSITAIENQAVVYFRVTDQSTTSANFGTVGTAGTDRIDNFLVSGTFVPIPEPSTMAMALCGFLTLGLSIFRNRK